MFLPECFIHNRCLVARTFLTPVRAELASTEGLCGSKLRSQNAKLLVKAFIKIILLDDIQTSEVSQDLDNINFLATSWRHVDLAHLSAKSAFVATHLSFTDH
jgi:hypothetical protein